MPDFTVVSARYRTATGSIFCSEK